MVNTNFEFYRENIPYGYPVIAHTTWSNGSTPELDVAPESGYILFVKKITFIMTQTFAISAGDFTIGHSSDTAPNEVMTIDHEDLLLSMENISALVAFPSGTNKVTGGWTYMVPIKCDAAASEQFEIKEGSALTLAGEIHITVHGWQMLKTDYTEVT